MMDRQQATTMTTEQMLMKAAIGQAILQLPATLTMAYLEATIRAPDLVRLESDPILYIRNSRHNDVHEAALMITIYWQKRRALFGPNRAFLPMNRTGSGALASQDIAALDQSCLCPLPSDADGHQVYFVDIAKIPNSTSDQGIRCLYYHLQSNDSNEMSASREGIVQLLIVGAQTQAENLERFVSLMSALLESMPLRLKRLHILTPSPTMVSCDSKISSMMRLVLGKSLCEESVVTGFVSQQDMVRKLACYGLHEDCLPLELGGSYNRVAPKEVQAAFIHPRHHHSLAIGPIPSSATTLGGPSASARSIMLQHGSAPGSFPRIDWWNERARTPGLGVGDELLTRAVQSRLHSSPSPRQLPSNTTSAANMNTAPILPLAWFDTPPLTLFHFGSPEQRQQLNEVTYPSFRSRDPHSLISS